jgi:hypothetical protein
MSRKILPTVAPAMLRDHGSPGRIDRGWARLERELPRRTGARASGMIPGLLLAGAALFLAGVYVGGELGGQAGAVATISPEPPRTVIVESAAGAAPSAPQPLAATDRAREGRSRMAPVRRRSALQVRRGVALPGIEVPLEEEPQAQVAVPVSDAPLWQGLADEGRYDEALSTIDAQGGFDAVVHQATAEHLMLLVDVARATGRHGRAVMALRRVVDHHGSNPNAPLAAWMLGNELARAGDTEGAARAFATYRALSPRGDFAQDALTRQFDAALDRGDFEQAGELAEHYARDFQESPRLAEMRGELERMRRALEAERLEAEAAERDAVEEGEPESGDEGVTERSSSALPVLE